MEVRPGYKLTEVGVIPEDWDFKGLGEITSGIYRGASPRPIDNPIWFDESSKIGWVRISDVTKSGRYLKETSQRLSSLGIRNSRYVPSGSLIMSICATVGRPIETSIDVCIHDGFVVFEGIKISQEYLYHILTELEPSWSQRGQTGSQMNLNTGIISRTKISIPPTINEQQAIADILNGSDELIEGLERLIAKKRQVKQGAMQELLTGRRRLPGFSGEWETVILGDIAQPRLERIDPKHTGVQGFCVELENIEQGTGCLLNHTTTWEGSSIKSVFYRGDVLFGKLRAYLRKYWLANQNGVCSTEIWVLVAKNHRITPEYLFQLVKTDSFVDIASYAYGTHMPRSDWNMVTKYPVNLPSRDEQYEIINVLSNMDGEINVLVKMLAKTKQMKQGMMQELLTGRIRLI